MQQQTSQLENIFTYSFPGNHLLQISLVRQETEKSYKKENFFFITLAPGETSQQDGVRTFNFNNRFTMKVECDRLMSLGHAIRSYANDLIDRSGKFSIFTDSSKSQYSQLNGTTTKTIFLNRNIDKNGNPEIYLTFKIGQNKGLAFKTTPSASLAIADVISFMTKKCLELEFNRNNIEIKPTKADFSNQQIEQLSNNQSQQQTDYEKKKVQDNFTQFFNNQF